MDFKYNLTNVTEKQICINTGGASSSSNNPILIALYVVLAVAIIFINSNVIHALRSLKRSRVDNYFLILSISDLGVGLLAPPAVIPFHVGFNEETLCSIFPYANFFLIFPYLFSWAMTIIISLDRCVLMTYPHVHSTYGTSFLTYFIPVSLVLSVTASILIFIEEIQEKMLLRMSENSLKVIPKTVEISIVAVFFIGAESLFTLFLGASQIYLILYVRKRMARMENNRHTNSNNNTKMTITIAIMFFCAAACNTPHFVVLSLQNVTKHNIETKLLLYRLNYWSLIVLYLNSFLNAVILLSRSSKLKKAMVFHQIRNKK